MSRVSELEKEIVELNHRIKRLQYFSSQVHIAAGVWGLCIDDNPTDVVAVIHRLMNENKTLRAMILAAAEERPEKWRKDKRDG